jgi:quercetin dioxygenase-like cupin family protein
MRSKTLAAGALMARVVVWSAVSLAEPAVKRSVLQKHDLRAHDMEGVMAQVEIPVGGREGRHTHPAEVFGYVIEGTLTVELEGKAPMTLKSGDSFFVEPGQIHEAINAGSTAAKLIAVFVTEKGKAMTTQVK